MANELTVDPKIDRGIKGMTKYADSLSITKEEDIISASERVKAIKELKDNLEAQRTQFTKPLNESLRNINAFFKKFSKPLEEADKLIRGKMVEFQKTLPENANNSFGEVHFTTTTVIEVVDIKKVPAEYLMVDEVKVRKALAEGVTNIKGLSITKDKKVSL